MPYCYTLCKSVAVFFGLILEIWDKTEPAPSRKLGAGYLFIVTSAMPGRFRYMNHLMVMVVTPGG